MCAERGGVGGTCFYVSCVSRQRSTPNIATEFGEAKQKTSKKKEEIKRITIKKKKWRKKLIK